MLKDNFNDSKIVNELRELTTIIYQNWWAERNGGNVSWLIDETEIKDFLNDEKPTRKIQLTQNCPEIANKYFLVTGAGKFYRNIAKKEKTKFNAGVIQINNDGSSYEIVWGFENETYPTSELPSHLLSHVVRLKQNPKHKLMVHSHPTNLIALTFVEPLDEKEFTQKMWITISEASVVFPEGLGIIPWMLPGSDEIGKKTAEKMATYRSVIWPHHGLFCSGETMDETLGLLECIEKSAMIYLKILTTNKPILQNINDEQLRAMANNFGYQLNESVFKK